MPVKPAMPPPITKLRDGSADEDLLLVLADLLAPVRELGDLVAQPLDGLPELDAVGSIEARICSGLRVLTSSSRSARSGRR